VRLIGKEANNIEEVQAGRYAQLDETITEYNDPADDHFHQHIMPLLDHVSGRELAGLVSADRRTIDKIRKGQIRAPGIALQQALGELAKRATRTDHPAIDGQKPTQSEAPLMLTGYQSEDSEW
jgi:hypothetical protein